PAGGVSLAGRAGRDAARGALLTVLLTHHPPASAGGQVLTTGQTLAALLGPVPVPSDGLAGLRVCPDQAALQALLDAQVLHRRRRPDGRTVGVGGPDGWADPGRDPPLL